jgi:hypothetical protein
MIVICKPYSAMTLAELRAEHAKWMEATRCGGWAASYEPAHTTRDTLATWIDRRERETKGGRHEIARHGE